MVVRLGLFELDNHHDVVYHSHCRKYCAPFVVRCSGKAEKRRQAGNHQACNGDDCAPSFGCLFLFEELFVYGVGVVIVTVVQVVVDCVRLAVDVDVDGENGHQVRRNVPVHRFVRLPTAGQFVLDNALQCALHFLEGENVIFVPNGEGTLRSNVGKSFVVAVAVVFRHVQFVGSTRVAEVVDLFVLGFAALFVVDIDVVVVHYGYPSANVGRSCGCFAYFPQKGSVEVGRFLHILVDTLQCALTREVFFQQSYAFAVAEIVVCQSHSSSLEAKKHFYSLTNI